MLEIQTKIVLKTKLGRKCFYFFFFVFILSSFSHCLYYWQFSFCVHVLVLHDFISMCFFYNYLSTCILVIKSKSIKIKSKTLSKVQTIHSPIIFNKHVFLSGFNVRVHCLWTYDTNLLKKDCTKKWSFPLRISYQ